MLWLPWTRCTFPTQLLNLATASDDVGMVSLSVLAFAVFDVPLRTLVYTDGEEHSQTTSLSPALSTPSSPSLSLPLQVLDTVAERLHARSKHGALDRAHAARHILRLYREGQLGRYTLDHPRELTVQ